MKADGHESCHTYASVLSHRNVLSLVWTNDVTHINESCRICREVISHMNESYHYHTYETVIIQKFEWCHFYEGDVSHVWMSNESSRRCVRQGDAMRMSHSCRIHEQVMLHIWRSCKHTHTHTYKHTHSPSLFSLPRTDSWKRCCKVCSW